MNKKNKSPLKDMKCMSKRAYESEEVANNVIAQMGARFGRKQRAYKCNNCSAWHTHTKNASKY